MNAQKHQNRLSNALNQKQPIFSASVFIKTIGIFFIGAFFNFDSLFAQAPGGVSGALLWLQGGSGVYADASGFSVSNDGGAVQLWSDRSGNGNDLTQPITAMQPRLQSSALTSLMNFNPGIAFSNAAASFMKRTDIFGGSNSQLTALVVARPNATNIQNGLFRLSTIGGGVYGAFYPSSDNNVYWDLASAGGTARVNTTSRTALTANVPTIGVFINDLSGNRQIAFVNGKNVANDATGGAVATNTVEIGHYRNVATGSFDGMIAEFITYNSVLSSGTENQVESYLALKYGITLDQSVARDYIASDGTTKMWNSAIAGSFTNNIFGIGRDDASALLQKVSNSANPRGITTIALQQDFSGANNATSRTNTFTNDKEFFTIADNSPAIGNPFFGSVDATINGKLLMNNQWQAQTNVAGGLGVYLQFNVGNSNYNVPSPGVNTVYYMVYDNSGIISGSSTVVRLTKTSGNLWSTASSIVLQNGAKFTLAAATDPLLPGATGPNQAVCPSTIPPNQLVETTTPTGGCAISSYQWQSSTDNGASWNTITDANSTSYTITTPIAAQTLYRRTITDICGNVAISAPDTIYITSPQGNPAAFGNGSWNVYAYDFVSSDFNSAIYRGYYSEPLLSFNSASRWNSTAVPSNASGYQGCAVGIGDHWLSYRRTNFTPNVYELDIASHDEAVYVLINGKQVFNHNGFGDTHTNIWTGKLGATDKVEFLWRKNGGASFGALDLAVVTPNTSINGGAINSSQNICLNTVPAAFSNVAVATSECYVYYKWQYRANCTGAWLDIPGAIDSAYSPTETLDKTTCYRRVATNACGITSYSNTVTVAVGPVLITSADTIICIGTNATVSASANGSSITWQGLGNNNSYVVSPSANSSYIVTAADSYGCQVTKTVNVAIDSIYASLNAFPQPAKAGYDIMLTASANHNFSVLAWKPAISFSNQTAITQRLIILDTSLYSVVIESQYGCRDTAQLTIIPAPNNKDFFVPNAFTPDGDGMNDLFKAYGRSIMEIELRVFNQWGQLLFETKDTNVGWNGYYNGSLQPAGSYIYTVRAKLYSGKIVSKKASFNLIK